MDKIAYPEQIEVPEWWSNGGGMSYRRDCLPVNHPEHPYHYIKNVLGLPPERYGYANPKAEKYKDHTRDELIDMIESLSQGIY